MEKIQGLGATHKKDATSFLGNSWMRLYAHNDTNAIFLDYKCASFKTTLSLARDNNPDKEVLIMKTFIMIHMIIMPK